jgi:hypothetical protein
MLRVRLSSRPLRALVFDIENRPLSYWYDRPTAEVTVIAYKWHGSKTTKILMQDPSTSLAAILNEFRPVYEAAEVVIGHNIRSHDLPILDGAYRELGMPGLTEKLTIDTYKQLANYKDIPKSLEYLAEVLGAPYEKFHMSQHSWREANRMEGRGLQLARKRCAVDVRVTEWVYDELVRRQWLTKPARKWKP